LWLIFLISVTCAQVSAIESFVSRVAKKFKNPLDKITPIFELKTRVAKNVKNPQKITKNRSNLAKTTQKNEKTDHFYPHHSTMI
jgi:hypothetical protein